MISRTKRERMVQRTQMRSWNSLSLIFIFFTGSSIGKLAANLLCTSRTAFQSVSRAARGRRSFGTCSRIALILSTVARRTGITIASPFSPSAQGLTPDGTEELPCLSFGPDEESADTLRRVSRIYWFCGCSSNSAGGGNPLF